jgi:complex iron-sulfur molybdoenzyme family reductase subunit alpha
LWGSNISQTRIPDAHFGYEARYNGGKIVAISPDFNASCTHADLYFQIKPGTDTALALGAARILIDENLIDVPYVKEQTDLPLLVVKSTKRFLRESDLKAGGKDDVFHLWDSKQQKAVAAPGSMGAEQKTIALQGIDPALTGSFTVTLADGKAAEVTPVFELLRSELAAYPLEQVAAVTGLPAHEIQAFSRELGTRKPAMIIHGAGVNHWFHNDLANRALILLVALTGNVGKNGGGFNHYVGQERVWPEHGFFELAFPETRKKQRFQNTTLWSYVHSANKDPHLYNGKPIEWYIKESVSNGWMPLWPKGALENKRKPRAFIVWRANYLNQAKGNEIIETSLWRDLDLIVDINYRMDTTALYSDVVLPAASYYEKVDLNTTDCHSYVHTFGKALDPLYESKTDWDIFHALAEKIAEVARKKGLKPYRDEAFEWERDFTRIADDWTGKGALVTDEQAADFILAHSKETQGMTYQNLQERPKRFVATDPEAWNSPIEEGVAYTPFKFQVDSKQPWRTLTGRQQFYIDHPWYIELGEALPVYKEPVRENDAYPLYWNTPHGRWSIHSTWRDHRAMLRLQRGLPIVYMHPDDARKRGLRDNDWVRIYNDIGQCVCRLQILPGEKPGRVTMYHGWEKYLGFQQGGWQSLTYIKIKPTQLIGKYGHVNFRLNYWGPTGNNRDIKVEIEKATVKV